MDSAACGSFAVLLLRRTCCEKHGCEEDCCEGNAENGLRRMACCEGSTENGLRRMACCEGDGCERTLLHVAHLPYTLLRNGSMCTRKTPGLPGRSHGKHKTVRRYEKVSAVRRWTHASRRCLLLLSCFSLASLLRTRRWTHASRRCLLLLSCFSLANAEMDTCKPALSLATLLLLSCKRGDGHMSTRR